MGQRGFLGILAGLFGRAEARPEVAEGCKTADNANWVESERLRFVREKLAGLSACEKEALHRLLVHGWLRQAQIVPYVAMLDLSVKTGLLSDSHGDWSIKPVFHKAVAGVLLG